MLNFKTFFNTYILNENVLNEVPRNILGMETTYKNFPADDPYGFWVDRSGNWMVVEYQGHLEAGIEIIKRCNDFLKSEGKPPIDTRVETTYNILFKAGFMRVTTNTYNRYYELYNASEKVTPAQKKFLSICKDMYGGEVENSNAY